MSDAIKKLTRTVTDEYRAKARNRTELEKLCDAHGVKCEAVQLFEGPRPVGPGATCWQVKLTFEGHSLVTPWSQGEACGTRAPGAADVLSCLLSDYGMAGDSFADFCSNLGLDEDSREAERTHRAIEEMAPKVRAFMGAHLESFANADH